MKIKFLLLTIAATGLVFGQRGAFGRGGPGGPGGPDTETRLTKTLNLSSAQQTVVHTALQEHRVNTSGLNEQMRNLNDQMRTAIKTGAMDQIAKLSASISSIHQQVMASESTAAAKIYASLTDDQKTQVGDHVEMLTSGGGFGGPHGRGGPPPRRNNNNNNN